MKDDPAGTTTDEEVTLDQITDKAKTESEAQQSIDELVNNKTVKKYNPGAQLPKWVQALLLVVVLGLVGLGVWWFGLRSSMNTESSTTITQTQPEISTKSYERIVYNDGTRILATTETGETETVYTLQENELLLEYENRSELSLVIGTFNGNDLVTSVKKVANNEVTELVVFEEPILASSIAVSFDGKVAWAEYGFSEEEGTFYYVNIFSDNTKSRLYEQQNQGDPLLFPLSWSGESLLLQELTCIGCDGPRLPSLWRTSLSGDLTQLFSLETEELGDISSPAASIHSSTNPDTFYIAINEHSLGDDFEAVKNAPSYVYEFNSGNNQLKKIFSTEAGKTVRFLGEPTEGSSVLIQTQTISEDKGTGFTEYTNPTIVEVDREKDSTTEFTLFLSELEDGGQFSSATKTADALIFATQKFGSDATRYTINKLPLLEGEQEVERIATHVDSTFIREASVLFSEIYTTQR